MTDYRKIENLDEFNDLVDAFVKSRNQLKKKLKENRGDIIATERVGDKPLTKLEVQQKPTIDAIKSLEQSLNPNRKGVFYKLFEEFTTTTKSQSEIKLTPKTDEGKLGTNGRVNLADLQDNIIRINNIKTGEFYSQTMSSDLAELLIKPYRFIDLNEIDANAFVNV
jgi:hypothetical protein